MSKEQSSNYLGHILNGAQPDICFLPGDDKCLKYSGCVNGYGQYLVPTLDGTVLLYSSRVEVKKPDISFGTFGPLPGIDFDKMVCPQVAIRAAAPMNHIVKEFNLITWNHTLYTESKTDIGTLSESIILFAQRLSIQTGRCVLIGGEMTIEFTTLEDIVKKLSTEQKELFLSNIQPEMSQLGYLPSMTNATFRGLRHLFEMKVFRCNANEVTKSKTRISNVRNNNVADCFIASKELELTEAKLVDVEQATARCIKMCPPALKEHAPTKTEMVITPRPPRHSGG